MILTVPFEEFAETVRRNCGTSDVYVSSSGRYAVASASGKGVVVATRVKGTVALAREKLAEQGLAVFNGTWLAQGPETMSTEPLSFAGVAYRSADERPGLWLDVYEGSIAEIDVLRRMYDEFCETGDLTEDLSFDEFIRRANANVVILTPDDIQRHIMNKRR